MPFKGDMRLGGPHDNERSLNGTSSDFESVPANGTLLSGPTDTSRYESDQAGNQFYMPYSTSVYADGLGGSYSVETWGLQYYPAGWVSNINYYPQYQYVDFAATCDNTITHQQNYWYANEVVYQVEDGTGITAPQVQYLDWQFTDGQVLWTYNDGNTDRVRIKWNANTQQIEFEDFTCSPAYGTILGYTGGDLYATTATCGDLVVGSYSGVDLADGYGGSFNSQSNSYVPYGTYLGVCGTMPNWDAWYYSNGNGGMYTYYAPVGFVLDSGSGDQGFDWSAPDGSTGHFNYYWYSYQIVADGAGGSNNNGINGGYSMGQIITSGTYQYNTGETDEEGNPIYTTRNYNLIYNGFDGYDTNTWD